MVLDVNTGIAPGLLVAAPSLSCPFFHHSVVLVVDHDAGGSFGFVINKLAGVALDTLIDQMDIPRTVTTSLPVLMGGPVSPQSGWIVYDREDTLAAEGDEDRALVIGTRTFGKGLVQTQRTLPSGWAVRLTTGKCYTPSGRSIQADHGGMGDERFVETDTAGKRPTFRSDAGRTVLGGGGVTPKDPVRP